MRRKRARSLASFVENRSQVGEDGVTSAFELIGGVAAGLDPVGAQREFAPVVVLECDRAAEKGSTAT
jgi:hypothetical protein